MKRSSTNLSIRAASIHDAREMSQLMQVLTENFIACDCMAEGLAGLLRSMSPEAIRDYLDSGYRYHVAVSAGRIVGVVGMSDECHLSFGAFM